MLQKRCLLLLFSCCCSIACAKENTTVPGLQVGVQAPNFKLADQSDEKHELKELLKQGPVAIVFHRSAEW